MPTKQLSEHIELSDVLGSGKDFMADIYQYSQRKDVREFLINSAETILTVTVFLVSIKLFVRVFLP